MYIFETTAPLSSYLQTIAVDMSQFTAWIVVDSATTKLTKQTRTFHNVHKALEFATKCNDKISKMNMDEKQTFKIVVLETELPVKRLRKKKRMADELVNDEENSSDTLTDFRLNVFNLIMDPIVKLRFVQQKQLYKELSCLGPTKV